MTTTRALWGVITSTATPLLLTGCLAVSPGNAPAGKASTGPGDRGPANAGAADPGPRPAARHATPPDDDQTGSSDLVSAPRSAAPSGGPSADTVAGAALAGDPGERGRPDPRPGLAATSPDPRRRHGHGHGRPTTVARPAQTSPGWPGGAPNSCGIAAAMGIFAPGSVADQACQEFNQQGESQGPAHRRPGRPSGHGQR